MLRAEDEQATQPISLPTRGARTTGVPHAKWRWALLAAAGFVALLVGTWLVMRPDLTDAGLQSANPANLPSAPAASTTDTEYTVVASDTMKVIAQKVYGDSEAWPRIYEANRQVIGPDPDALRVGTRLQVPRP